VERLRAGREERMLKRVWKRLPADHLAFYRVGSPTD
jgi:hypothetical protein